jgi:uncharacterized membrane protein
MAELIAVAYPDKNTARDVVQTLSRLQTEHVVELTDVAVATKEQDGKVRLAQGRDLVALGALGGALWGGLIGLLFFAPLLGMVAGMAGGALGGKFSDYGIDDRFMKDLAAQFQPGGAAVFLLLSKATSDKVLEEVVSDPAPEDRPAHPEAIETLLDEIGAQSFPASDPPAWGVVSARLDEAALASRHDDRRGLIRGG